MADPKSRIELIEQVAIILGPLSPGEILQDTDNVLIGNIITPALEELSADSIVTVDDEDAIDPKIFLPLAAYLAEKCAPSYGRPTDNAVIALAKHDLRVAVRNQPTREPLAVDFF